MALYSYPPRTYPLFFGLTPLILWTFYYLVPLDLGGRVPLHGEGDESMRALAGGVLVAGGEDAWLLPTLGVQRGAHRLFPVLNTFLINA